MSARLNRGQNTKGEAPLSQTACGNGALGESRVSCWLSEIHRRVALYAMPEPPARKSRHAGEE